MCTHDKEDSREAIKVKKFLKMKIHKEEEK